MGQQHPDPAAAAIAAATLWVMKSGWPTRRTDIRKAGAIWAELCQQPLSQDGRQVQLLGQLLEAFEEDEVDGDALHRALLVRIALRATGLAL